MNARAPRIVITGFMGAGKTTVARALAARLGCTMLDTDESIVEREGRNIAAIIEGEGEARFREIEAAVLRDALEGQEARVIALGGGAWTLTENRAAISAHDDCVTVWLDAPFALCWRRIAHAGHARPLARDRDHALALYTARRAAYELATLRVQINEDRDAEDTAAQIESIIERQSVVEKRT